MTNEEFKLTRDLHKVSQTNNALRGVDLAKYLTKHEAFTVERLLLQLEKELLDQVSAVLPPMAYPLDSESGKV